MAYVYDGLGRISRRTVNAGSTGVATTYGYLAGGHGTNSTTPLVQTITQSGTTLTYAYDDAGNITSVSDGSKTISYEYDLLGQLTRVNDPHDTTADATGTTWLYTYDLGGNIQSKVAYAFTTGTVGSAVKSDLFAYGDANWKDKLTAFNGQAITYDAIGNPTNDSTWNYSWINGRRLRCMHKGELGEQGYDEITFEYNENGLRTKKTRMYYDNATGDIGYKVTNYTLHGKNIVHMSDGSNDLHFFYDAQNKPAVVIFNGTAYAYLYNLQGDVIGLVDSNGTKMVSYSYDAWGKPISKTGTLASTLGTIQPFRYRGYVFDEETILYYMRSRYYDAAKQRFVNADSLYDNGDMLLNHNKYAYCNNKPVIHYDQDGNSHLVCASLMSDSGGISSSNDFATYALPRTQAPFMQKNRQNPAKLTKIPRSYLLSCLDEIVRSNDWKYSPNSMCWKKVECVSIVRIIVQQQSQQLCRSLPTTADGMRTLCGIPNEHENQIIAGMTLTPGMAVFTFDPTHLNANQKSVSWYHMGVYVGNYVNPVTNEYIPNAVIHAANPRAGIVVCSLSDSSFTHYAYMPFIDYGS